MAALKKGYTRVRFIENTSYGFPLDSTHAPAEEALNTAGNKVPVPASQQFVVGEVADLPDSDAEIVVADGCAVVVDAKGNEVDAEEPEA